jgi:hypothetical protein
MMSVRAVLIFVNSAMSQCSARLRACRGGGVIYPHLPAAITEMDGSGHYVARPHQADFDPALTGWTGHARPFEMTEPYQPAEGIGRARIGTPPMLSLLALEAALTAFDGVDLAELRVKSLSVTEFFIDCALYVTHGARCARSRRCATSWARGRTDRSSPSGGQP